MFLSRIGSIDHYKNCHVILEPDKTNNLGALWLGDYTAAQDKKMLHE